MRKILAEQTLDGLDGAKLTVKVLGPSDRTMPTKGARERGRSLRVLLLLEDPTAFEDAEIDVSCSELSTVIGKGIHRAIAEGVMPR